MNTLATEIWSQIFWHACVDTGYTGCSISETCRFFNNVGKPTKFRSVALRGLSNVISFWHSIKSLPSHHLRIENMYILAGQYLDDGVDITHLPISVHREGGDSEMPAMTIIVDVLTAAAPALIYLYLCLEMNREAIFLPVKFPHLSELVIHGPYSDHLTQIGRLPTFTNLRKLRISNPYSFEDFKAISAITTCVPYLTHLRVDCPNSFSKTFISTVQHTLQLSPEISASTFDDPPKSRGPADLKFPASLERLLIHPGVVFIPRCGFSAMVTRQSEMALDQFVKSDSRVFLYRYDEERERDIPRKSLKEWLDRIKGELSYWEEE